MNLPLVVLDVTPVAVDVPPVVIVEPTIFNDPKHSESREAFVELAGCSKDTEFTKNQRRTQLSKRKELELLIENEAPEKVIKSFTKVIKSQDNERLSNKSAHDLEAVINTCLQSPNKSTEVLEKKNQHTIPYIHSRRSAGNTN